MICEQSFFIQVLADHIAQRQTFPPLSELDWNAITKLSRTHQVSGILYYQCKDFLPLSIKNNLEKNWLFDIFQYTIRKKMLMELESDLSRKHIRFSTFKGHDLADYYPIPFLRTMGDLDILVLKEDKERAHQILIERGFQTKVRNPEYDWVYFKQEIIIELHHQLFYVYDNSINVEDQVRFFNNFWEYVSTNKLEWNFHFLYLLAHLRKHLLNKGAGFRMFMDLAVLLNSNILFDWEWIEHKLKELDLLKFAQVCFGLIEQWFGVVAPIDYEKIERGFFESITEKICSGGIFGFDDERNRDNVDINLIMKNDRPRRLSRFLLIFYNAFPGYTRMAYTQEYHFLNGKPWLLPFAWIYRFYRLLAGKTEPASSIMKRIMIHDEKIKERENELHQWGLK